jgi:phytoene dehydrogenase-like protein
LDRHVEAMIPVDVACLDLALARLPQPETHFALALDQPLYFSVHSAVADLAPAGAAAVHVAKYLDRGATGKTDLNELEGLLDRVQPGWRELIVWRRFLPSMRAANALVTAADGGLDGRPIVAFKRITGLYFAGDWVGPEGMLGDAALGSAAQASEMIVSRASRSIDA